VERRSMVLERSWRCCRELRGSRRISWSGRNLRPRVHGHRGERNSEGEVETERVESERWKRLKDGETTEWKRIA
jgi:hypothetical protein